MEIHKIDTRFLGRSRYLGRNRFIFLEHFFEAKEKKYLEKFDLDDATNLWLDREDGCCWSLAQHRDPAVSGVDLGPLHASTFRSGPCGATSRIEIVKFQIIFYLLFDLLWKKYGFSLITETIEQKAPSIRNSDCGYVGKHEKCINLLCLSF
jgi:hypothetical protein